MSLFSIFSTTINFDDQPLFSMFTDKTAEADHLNAIQESTKVLEKPTAFSSIFTEVAKPNSENFKKLFIIVIAVCGIAFVTIGVSKFIANKRNKVSSHFFKKRKNNKKVNNDIPKNEYIDS